MNIEVSQATPDHLPIVRNLIAYYVYDMSQAVGWDCDEEGVFGGSDDIAEYWCQGHPETPESERWPKGMYGVPFFVRVDYSIAGFANMIVIPADPEPVNDMGEFFVLGRFRRQGVGRQVAHSLFRRFPGPWQVRELLLNRPAQAFWRAVISEFAGGFQEEVVPRREDQVWWLGEVIQRFRSEGEPSRTFITFSKRQPRHLGRWRGFL